MSHWSDDEEDAFFLGVLFANAPWWLWLLVGGLLLFSYCVNAT